MVLVELRDTSTRPKTACLHAALTQYRATSVGNSLRIMLQDRCQALNGMAGASLFGEGEPARLP